VPQVVLERDRHAVEGSVERVDDRGEHALELRAPPDAPLVDQILRPPVRRDDDLVLGKRLLHEEWSREVQLAGGPAPLAAQ